MRVGIVFILNFLISLNWVAILYREILISGLVSSRSYNHRLILTHLGHIGARMKVISLDILSYPTIIRESVFNA
jgi:hypothetical protein